MTPAKFKAHRIQLGLTQVQMGRALDMNGPSGARLVRRWENGEARIPRLLPLALIGALTEGRLDPEGDFHGTA